MLSSLPSLSIFRRIFALSGFSNGQPIFAGDAALLLPHLRGGMAKAARRASSHAFDDSASVVVVGIIASRFAEDFSDAFMKVDHDASAFAFASIATRQA
jgi:hypothetical protein